MSILRKYTIHIVSHRHKANGLSVFLIKSQKYPSGYRFDFSLGTIRRVHTVEKLLESIQALLQFYDIEGLEDIENLVDKLKSVVGGEKTELILHFGQTFNVSDK